MKALAHRLWHSPTIMTWMSYSTKALSLFIVLPLVLKSFSAAEVSLWYLFSSIIVLSSLADFGFRTTFSRIIAYAYGGAEDVGIQRGDTKSDTKEPNWSLIESICSNMKVIYGALSVFVLLLFVTFGSWSLEKPISAVENQQDAWLAWWFIVGTSVIRFYGTIYQNYLDGLFKVALVRRVESFMFLGSIVTSIIVLLAGGRILELVIASQIWAILNVLRNLILANRINEGKYADFKHLAFNKILFMKIWSPAWRSGISGLMSNGLTQLSGILYAQIGTPEIVASYLLALKIITQIKEVSMAPFYSKIPLMSRFRVSGQLEELKSIAQKGMFLGHFVFVMGVIGVALLARPLMELIDSDTPFVNPSFWLMLSFAFFAHRYGAMHMQVYLTSNHVISHIADGISGLLFGISSFLLIDQLGISAIPIGMLVGYLGFYSWYAARHSLQSLNVGFMDFEIRGALIPMVVFIIFAVTSILTT